MSTINLLPNAISPKFACNGNYLYVVSATGTFNFTITDATGKQTQYQSGPQLSFVINDIVSGIVSITFADSSNAANTIVFEVGMGNYSVPLPQVIEATYATGSGVVDTAVAVAGATGDVLAAGTGRKSVRFTNAGPGMIYLGGADVSVGGGIPIPPGQGWIEGDGPNAPWYAISNSASTLNVQVVS